jgi:hypothetical protein
MCDNIAWLEILCSHQRGHTRLWINWSKRLQCHWYWTYVWQHCLVRNLVFPPERAHSSLDQSLPSTLADPLPIDSRHTFILEMEVVNTLGHCTSISSTVACQLSHPEVDVVMQKFTLSCKTCHACTLFRSRHCLGKAYSWRSSDPPWDYPWTS